MQGYWGQIAISLRCAKGFWGRIPIRGTGFELANKASPIWALTPITKRRGRESGAKNENEYIPINHYNDFDAKPKAYTS